MTVTETQVQPVETRDPNEIPHLLRALDRYMMQNQDLELSAVVQEVANNLGINVDEVTNPDLTEYLTARAAW